MAREKNTAHGTETAYVLVEVKNGVAEVTRTKGNVEVAIIDWDNIKAGDEIDKSHLQHAVFGPWINAESNKFS